jgi:glutamyl-tRNA synthetase
MLAFLGWNPGTEQELFSMTELIDTFSLDRVHKSGARFDPEKTIWFNEQYLRKQPTTEIAERILPQALSRYPLKVESPIKYISDVVELVKDRVRFENEILDNAPYLFCSPTAYDQKVIEKKWSEKAATFFQQLISNLETNDLSTAAEAKTVFENTAAATQTKPGEVLQLFRVILSGEGSGVDLFGMIALLGKEEVLSRTKTALSQIGINKV